MRFRGFTQDHLSANQLCAIDDCALKALVRWRRYPSEADFPALSSAPSMLLAVIALLRPIAGGQPAQLTGQPVASRNNRPGAPMERNLLDHSIPSTPQQDDDALISRIIVAYLIAIRDFPGHGSSGWRGINALADDMHKLLLTGDQSPVSAALRNPHTTDLFAGFDPLNRSLHTSASGDHAATSAFAQLSYLASAAAAMQVPNPETSDPRPVPQAEELLTTLDERFGFTIDFPNPYPFEIGLRTSRGVASHRALHAIYQAWRLWELGGQRSQARIMEIGAGLGRTAYYARKFGMRDYTIIDIPLSNVAQAHFLGSVLGSEAVALVGEPAVSGAIRIIGPSFTSETREKFDIVLNVNSLVEMDRNVANSYFTFAAQHARYFLSINHEHHPFRFIDVAGTQARFVSVITIPVLDASRLRRGSRRLFSR